MSKKSSSKTNFLAQGTILVIASFVAKAIGMIYRIPLTHILGDDGNGYYSTANEIYTIILMISSFSLPLAVSRLVAEREYAGEVKNSYRVLICSLRFAAVTGGILSSPYLVIPMDSRTSACFFSIRFASCSSI